MRGFAQILGDVESAIQTVRETNRAFQTLCGDDAILRAPDGAPEGVDIVDWTMDRTEAIRTMGQVARDQILELKRLQAEYGQAVLSTGNLSQKAMHAMEKAGDRTGGQLKALRGILKANHSGDTALIDRAIGYAEGLSGELRGFYGFLRQNGVA